MFLYILKYEYIKVLILDFLLKNISGQKKSWKWQKRYYVLNNKTINLFTHIFSIIFLLMSKKIPQYCEFPSYMGVDFTVGYKTKITVRNTLDILGCFVYTVLDLTVSNTADVSIQPWNLSQMKELIQGPSDKKITFYFSCYCTFWKVWLNTHAINTSTMCFHCIKDAWNMCLSRWILLNSFSITSQKFLPVLWIQIYGFLSFVFPNIYATAILFPYHITRLPENGI